MLVNWDRRVHGHFKIISDNPVQGNEQSVWVILITWTQRSDGKLAWQCQGYLVFGKDQELEHSRRCPVLQLGSGLLSLMQHTRLASSCLQAHLLQLNLQFLIWPGFCPFTSQQNLILHLHSQPWLFLRPQQQLLPYIWFRLIMLSTHTLYTFSQPISKPLKLCCVLSNLYLLYLFYKPYR